MAPSTTITKRPPRNLLACSEDFPTQGCLAVDPARRGARRGAGCSIATYTLLSLTAAHTVAVGHYCCRSMLSLTTVAHCCPRCPCTSTRRLTGAASGGAQGAFTMLINSNARPRVGCWAGSLCYTHTMPSDMRHALNASAGVGGSMFRLFLLLALALLTVQVRAACEDTCQHANDGR